MKKMFVRIIALVLSLLMVSAVFLGCNNEESKDSDGENQETPGASAPAETQDTTPMLDDSKFNIYYNKEYICRFVLPKNATTEEKLVAKEFRTLLQKHTGKQITFVTEDKVTDEYKFLVLVGNTSYQESKDAIKALGDRQGTAKVVNNKLVIAFSNQSAGIGIAKAVVDELVKCSKSEVRLSLTYKNTYKALPEIDVLPQYDDGTVQEIDCYTDTTMLYVKNSSLDVLEAYAASLEDVGLKKISDRVVEGNVYFTYRSENHYIYMYYTKYSGAIRIITGPFDQYCEEDYSSNLPETETPYVASIPQHNDGQGYIIRLADGRFIVQDGGYNNGNDRVYSTLRTLQPNGKIVIAAWFISHPHGDHYPGYIEFIKNHGSDKDITLERVIHNYVHPDKYILPNSTAGSEDCSNQVKELYQKSEIYVPDVPIIKAHTGQVITFGSLSIEVLYTIEDMLPATMANSNASSFVFRMFVEGQSFMMLADTYHDSGDILCNMWGSYLESDILQVAHHAMWPAKASLYHTIKGKLVLITAIRQNYKSYVNDSRWKDVTDAYLQYAKDISLSLDDMVIIELPYVFKNNKTQVLNDLKN